MKHITRSRNFSSMVVVFLVLFGEMSVPIFAQTSKATSEKEIVRSFETKVRDYVKLRNQVKEKIPKLSKESTPEQIQAFMNTFADATRQARVGAKAGDIFVPQVAVHIRKVLRTHFQGMDRVELRKTIFEAETQGVPVRINYPYPQSKEFTEMPPKLLLKLPQLPNELRYRFVGRNMLLVDRENNLIVDYMVDALP